MAEIVVKRSGHAAVVGARVVAGVRRHMGKRSKRRQHFANFAIVLLESEADDMNAEAEDAARTRWATLVIIAILLCVALVYTLGLFLIVF